MNSKEGSLVIPFIREKLRLEREQREKQDILNRIKQLEKQIDEIKRTIKNNT